MSDCRALRESSQYVRAWIQKQPEVKEESLSDWLLFDVSQKIARITYKAFSRQEEARKTGADWEWWFLFDSFAFKMHVQAKKLCPHADQYAGIAYTNKHGLQIEKLLSNSKLANAMPFYAFYTIEEADVMCKRHRNDEGVFMAGAQGIRDEVIAVPRRPVESPDLLKHTLALSCFLCCPLASDKERTPGTKPDDPSDGWGRFIQQYYASELKHAADGGKDTNLVPGMHRQIPEYVRSFIETRREGLPDWWEREFHHEIENVGALVVYDARERPTTP